MDFVVRLIGIIVIVTGGSTPDIAVNTALAPRATKSSYCNKTHTVDSHTAYVRVSDTAIASEYGWGGKIACVNTPTFPEKCWLFEIPAGSELTIVPAFPLTGSSTHAKSYCHLPLLNDVKSTIKLIPNPRSQSYFAYEFPSAQLESASLLNGSAMTYFWVRGPGGGSPTDFITIQAGPFGASPTRTLKVKPGTTISILYLPKDHATGDLNAMHMLQPAAKRHFYLINELLSAADEICVRPPLPHPFILNPDGSVADCGSPDGDPFCSNNGCCL